MQGGLFLLHFAAYLQGNLKRNTKALNGIHWEVAHPLTLNDGAPIASMDATMCFSGEGTSYVGTPLTHMVASIEAKGAP